MLCSKPKMDEMEENPSSSQEKIASPKLEGKISALESKAIALEKQFDGILRRTAEIETWVHQYERKITEEKRMFGLLHTLVRPGDKRATILMNHVCVFFDEVLTRLENRGLRYNTLKSLKRDLAKEEIKSTLGEVLKDMEFTDEEIKDVNIIISLIHSRVIRKTPLVNSYDLTGIADDPAVLLQEIKVYLQVRDELDESLRSVLKKIVARCYKDREDAMGDQNNNE